VSRRKQKCINSWERDLSAVLYKPKPNNNADKAFVFLTFISNCSFYIGLVRLFLRFFSPVDKLKLPDVWSLMPAPLLSLPGRTAGTIERAECGAPERQSWMTSSLT